MAKLDVHQSSLLVFGVYFWLFIVSASQCDSKKQANGCGQGVASVGACTEKVDTVCKKVASVAGEVETSVLVKIPKGESQHDHELEELFQKIGNLGKELHTLISSQGYSDFLNSLKEQRYKSKRRMIWEGGYYRTCSVFYLFFEQSNLLNQVEQYKDQRILVSLVRLLSSSHRGSLPFDECKNAFKTSANIDLYGPYEADKFKTFLSQKCGAAMHELSSRLGIKVTPKYFMTLVNTIKDAINGCDVPQPNPHDGLDWDSENYVGKLSIILTKIEFHLLKIFPPSLWNRLACEAYEYRDHNFFKLVHFFRDPGVQHAIYYNQFSTMDFEHLDDKVRYAFKYIKSKCPAIK